MKKTGRSYSKNRKLRIPSFPEFDICKHCAEATYSFLSLRHDELVGGPLMKTKIEQDEEVMKKIYTKLSERNNQKRMRLGGMTT